MKESQEAKRLAARAAALQERAEIRAIVMERRIVEREERRLESEESLGRGIQISPWHQLVYMAPRGYRIPYAA